MVDASRTSQASPARTTIFPGRVSAEGREQDQACQGLATWFPERVAFASWPSVLTRLPGVGRDVDLGSVYSYLNFGFVPAPGSIFAGLLRLPPGHLAKLRADGSLVEPYWDMTYPVWQQRHVDGAGLP